jgi:hypothetical protein
LGICVTPTGRPEPRQDVHQIGLVVGLERARHHGAGDDAQWLGLRQIILEWKVRRRIALVGHDRETMIDDVAVTVEQPPLLGLARSCGERKRGAAGHETAAIQQW